MTRWMVCGAVVGLLVSTAAAQTDAGARGGAAPTPRSVSTLKLLNQRIPEVAFVDAPFESVMEWVAEFTQANVVVRWQTIEDAGIERDKPISVKAKNLSLTQVLWLIMNEAGGQEVKLAYRASGSLLILSTVEDLNQEMVVKVYDVTDLLARVPDFYNAARLDPAQALNQLGQGGQQGGGQSQLFESEQNDEDRGRGDQQDNADIQELIDLITVTIEPDSWVQGGGTGTIQAFRGMLVVRNTLLVHQRIGGYVLEQDDLAGP